MEDLDIGLLKDLTKIGIEPEFTVVNEALRESTVNSDLDFIKAVMPAYRTFDGCWITSVHTYGLSKNTQNNKFLSKVKADTRTWKDIYTGFRVTLFRFSNGKRARLEMLYPDSDSKNKFAYTWVYPCTLKILSGKTNTIEQQIDSYGVECKHSNGLNYYEVALNALEHFGLNLGTNNGGKIITGRCLHTSNKIAKQYYELHFAEKSIRSRSKKFTA